MRPGSWYDPERDKKLALFYNVVSAFLNPIIYSLRNRDVKGAFLKVLGGRGSAQWPRMFQGCPESWTGLRGLRRDHKNTSVLINLSLPGAVSCWERVWPPLNWRSPHWLENFQLPPPNGSFERWKQRISSTKTMSLWFKVIALLLFLRPFLTSGSLCQCNMTMAKCLKCAHAFLQCVKDLGVKMP